MERELAQEAGRIGWFDQGCQRRRTLDSAARTETIRWFGRSANSSLDAGDAIEQLKEFLGQESSGHGKDLWVVELLRSPDGHGDSFATR